MPQLKNSLMQTTLHLFSGKLWKLKKTAKYSSQCGILSKTKISKLTNDFGSAFKQNKGNPASFQIALKNIVDHNYGKHDLHTFHL